MFLTSFERNLLPFVLFWKDCECFIRILTWCGKYVTGKKKKRKTFLNEKKSGTMSVLGEFSESNRGLKMNSNVFQRRKPTASVFLTTSCSCECTQNKFTHQQPSRFGHLQPFKGFIFKLPMTTHYLFFKSLCYDWPARSVLLHTGSSLSPPALSASHLSLLIGTACSQKPLIC